MKLDFYSRCLLTVIAVCLIATTAIGVVKVIDDRHASTALEKRLKFGTDQMFQINLTLTRELRRLPG